MEQERIIELEIKQAYQDDLIETLNRVLADQQQQITRLEETCKLLHEKIKGINDDMHEQGRADERPPHY